MQAAANNPADKIRRANLPPYVETTTLVEEKAPLLREIVQKREYKKATGLTGYIFHSTGVGSRNRVARLTAVFGKELVLSGCPVQYITMAGFLREVRLQDYAAEREPLNPILKEVGKGYFVIADFDDIETPPSISVLRDGLDILMQHMSYGGGLVLAASPSNLSNTQVYPPSFIAGIAQFTRMAV